MAAKVPFSTPLPKYRRPSIEEFYEIYHPYTLTSVLALEVNPSDAEDMVHEVFIKFLYGGYYDSYDPATNVSFKNFYRHVMKLYLRGMSESYRNKRARVDLMDSILEDTYAAPPIESAEQLNFEFMETIRSAAKLLTDAEAVVLFATAHMAVDRATKFTSQEIAREAGIEPEEALSTLHALADSLR